MSWKKVAYLDEVAALSDNPPQDVKVQTAAAGTGTAASRDDHKHNVATGVPGNITEGATASEGTATSLARSDHVHGTPATWTPSAHATTHKSGGSDEILLHEFGAPTGAVNFNEQEATALALENQATNPTTTKAGRVVFNTGDNHVYVYVPA